MTQSEETPAQGEVVAEPQTPPAEEPGREVVEYRQRRGVQIGSFEEAKTIAQAFAQSGLFKDVRDASKAIVQVMAGAELGIGPFEAMRGIHVVEGKLEVSGDLYGKMVKRHPAYDYRVVESTNERCEIAFFERGREVGRHDFSVEDAKRAGLVKERGNWVKYPRAMCFNRAMSAGVKQHIPDAVGPGVYIEGEIEGEDTFVIETPAPSGPAAPAAEDKPQFTNEATGRFNMAINGMARAALQRERVDTFEKGKEGSLKIMRQVTARLFGDRTAQNDAELEQVTQGIRQSCIEHFGIDPLTGEVVVDDGFGPAPAAAQAAEPAQGAQEPPPPAPDAAAGATAPEAPPEAEKPAQAPGGDGGYTELVKAAEAVGVGNAVVLQAMLEAGAQSPADLDDPEKFQKVRAAIDAAAEEGS